MNAFAYRKRTMKAVSHKRLLKRNDFMTFYDLIKGEVSCELFFRLTCTLSPSLVDCPNVRSQVILKAKIYHKAVKRQNTSITMNDIKNR